MNFSKSKGFGKNLVISADDFGKSDLANRNILKLAEAGKLDRVSVIASEKFREKEFKSLLGTGAKLDVHLHLFNRLEDMNEIKEGFLKRSIIFFSNYIFGLFNKKKVKEEWERQIGRFMKIAGKVPDGINAHRYDHFFPVYFPLVVELAKKYKIERIRFGKVLPAGKNILTAKILKLFREKSEKEFLKSGLRSYGYCANLDWVSNPDIFLMNLPDGEVELVTHPERGDEYNFVNNLVK